VLRRTPSLLVATTVGLITLFALPSRPALAHWGSGSCIQEQSPTCRVSVGTDGPSTSGTDGSPQSGGDAAATDPDPIVCIYVPTSFQPQGDTAGAAPSSTGGEPASGASPTQRSASTPAGAWFTYECSSRGTAASQFDAPIWIPIGPPTLDTPAVPSPAVLAQQADNELTLPSPRIGISPSIQQLVNLPTWLWISTNSWTARSATATVPGESVTATATPTSVTWGMGNGDTVTCNQPGTPYTAATNPATASPDCGYTYRQSSATQPSGAFTVTATTHWTVRWAGAGQSGIFDDLTSTATLAVPVAESQALNGH
jgi:hypothetical protein